jgi:hypothetical protein
MPLKSPTKGQRMENYVRGCLVHYPRMFSNYYGDFLPRMRTAIPGQFNNPGHGFDILAVDDTAGNLWVIEVSAGMKESRAFKGYLVKTLENRKRAGGKAQMSPEWRRYAFDALSKSPDLIQRLSTLFERPESERDVLLKQFAARFEDHSYAIVVPEGCHVEGDNPGIEFASTIYTLVVGRS